jgi:hypothetical protein
VQKAPQKLYLLVNIFSQRGVAEKPNLFFVERKAVKNCRKNGSSIQKKVDLSAVFHFLRSSDGNQFCFRI